jgi:hypothetical protein
MLSEVGTASFFFLKKKLLKENVLRLVSEDVDLLHIFDRRIKKTYSR